MFSVFLHFWEKLLNCFKALKLGHCIKHTASATNIQDHYFSCVTSQNSNFSYLFIDHIF